jgi:hypothetical protein
MTPPSATTVNPAVFAARRHAGMVLFKLAQFLYHSRQP